MSLLGFIFTIPKKVERMFNRGSAHFWWNFIQHASTRVFTPNSGTFGTHCLVSPIDLFMCYHLGTSDITLTVQLPRQLLRDRGEIGKGTNPLNTSLSANKIRQVKCYSHGLVSLSLQVNNQLNHLPTYYTNKSNITLFDRPRRSSKATGLSKNLSQTCPSLARELRSITGKELCSRQLRFTRKDLLKDVWLRLRV